MKSLFQHEETTHGVTVRVAVSFLPEQSEVASGRWVWAYHIRLENHSETTVQLITRHWTITDGRGSQHRVEGKGVVGEQPVLKPGKTHDYVSGCPLDTPTGRMEGHYRMQREDGEMIDVVIPPFALVAPATAD